MKNCNDCDELKDFWKTVDSFEERFPPLSIITDYRKIIGCLEARQVFNKKIYCDSKLSHPHIKVDNNIEILNGVTIGQNYIIYVDYYELLDWSNIIFFLNKEGDYEYKNKTKCVVCGFDDCSILNNFNKYRDKKQQYLLCCEHAMCLDQGCCNNCNNKRRK